LDNRYYENVIAEMQGFIDENGFKENDGVFSNEKKSFTVKYDEEKQFYILSVADVEDGKAGDFRNINSWLFDDSQTAKDAASVGIDFVGSLRKELGIKLSRRSSDLSAIDMPTASKGDVVDIQGFTKKILDVFPTLKDLYKEHVSIYGNFLYMNFFGEHLTPILKNLFETGTKKQIKKFYEVLENAYIKGNKETVNVCVAVLCAAAKDSETATAAIKEMLAENAHFLASFTNFLPVFAKNKKLCDALIK